jgi:hypothetical protein
MNGGYLPRSPRCPDAGGVLVDEASHVELDPHELVSVTGCPAWKGEA